MTDRGIFPTGHGNRSRGGVLVAYMSIPRLISTPIPLPGPHPPFCEPSLSAA